MTALTEAAKQQAIQDMIDLTEVSEKENAAETLLMAKGFSDPVVSITKDKVDVVINAPSITDPQRAQIEDIVKREGRGGSRPDYHYTAQHGRIGRRNTEGRAAALTVERPERRQPFTLCPTFHCNPPPNFRIME